MSEFYSNLPQKDKDSLDKTQDNLVKNVYQEKFQFNVNRYKSSRLGVRTNRTAKDVVSRNIVD